MQAELEVLVLKLDAASEPITLEESPDTDKIGNNTRNFINVCCLLQCLVFWLCLGFRLQKHVHVPTVM